MDGYSIPATDGAYDVTLHMAEAWFDSSGERVFDVALNGRTVLEDFDVFAAAGGKFRAVDRTFRTTVAGGPLKIDFKAHRNLALVSAISVVPVLSDGPGTTESPVTSPPTPVPTSPPTPPTGSTEWGAPALVNPLVWTPSRTSRRFIAPPDRDVLVRWPSTPLDVPGGFEISGGRNVVSTGGTVTFSRAYFPPMTDGANQNRCLHITGNSTRQPARTVHVEGLHCAGDFHLGGHQHRLQGRAGQPHRPAARHPRRRGQRRAPR